MAEVFEKKHENPIFRNTGPYGDTPFRLLKVEISKIGIGHVLRWSEPNFMTMRLWVALEKVDKIYPEFLTLDNVSTPT